MENERIESVKDCNVWRPIQARNCRSLQATAHSPASPSSQQQSAQAEKVNRRISLRHFKWKTSSIGNIKIIIINCKLLLVKFFDKIENIGYGRSQTMRAISSGSWLFRVWNTWLWYHGDEMRQDDTDTEALQGRWCGNILLDIVIKPNHL